MFYKKLSFFILALVCSGLIKSQEKKDNYSYYDLKGIRRINVNGSGTLVVSTGKKELLKVNANEKDVANKIQMIGDLLSINPPTGFFGSGYVFSIELPSIDLINANGNFAIKGTLKQEKDITLQVNGFIKADLSIYAPVLLLGINGHSKVRLAGSIPSQYVYYVDGSSSYNAEHLFSQNCAINVGGSSSALLNCLKIQGSVGGSSTLDYVGAPEIQVQKSGIGAIRRLPKAKL